jgi:ABC-2 type transport system ATP-binding protein
MADTIFEACNVTKKYGESYALRNINMTIQTGELYGLVGENGAGKTTLMNIISGLVSLTSGKISLFNKEGDLSLTKARRNMGVLIEKPALYTKMNAMENLTFYSRMYGIQNEKQAIHDVLDIVSLKDCRKKKVEEYSMGMKQRLGLAVALLPNPKLLILDEPINGLDPTGIIDTRNILEKLVKEQGISILISSHILSELQVLVTRIGFLHKGKLIEEITSKELSKKVDKVICIKTNQPTKTYQLLEDHLQVNHININENGELLIVGSNVQVQTIMEILLANQIKIEGISLTTNGLEEYYMGLIHKSILEGSKLS